MKPMYRIFFRGTYVFFMPMLKGYPYGLPKVESSSYLIDLTSFQRKPYEVRTDILLIDLFRADLR